MTRPGHATDPHQHNTPGGAPVAFVLDVDGVLTDGKSLYTADGKVAKNFGPDDHDALCLLRDSLEVRFISGDRRGFEISRARVETDMGFPLDAVSTIDRLAWISERYPPERVIYMGDGIFDPLVFAGVGYAICTADGDADARDAADFVTKRNGGDRAVAEAAKHVMDRFFGGVAGFFERAAAREGPAVAGGWSEIKPGAAAATHDAA